MRCNFIERERNALFNFNIEIELQSFSADITDCCSKQYVAQIFENVKRRFYNLSENRNLNPTIQQQK